MLNSTFVHSRRYSAPFCCAYDRPVLHMCRYARPWGVKVTVGGVFIGLALRITTRPSGLHALHINRWVNRIVAVIRPVEIVARPPRNTRRGVISLADILEPGLFEEQPQRQPVVHPLARFLRQPRIQTLTRSTTSPITRSCCLTGAMRLPSRVGPTEFASCWSRDGHSRSRSHGTGRS